MNKKYLLNIYCLNMEKHFNLFFILVIINALFSNQKPFKMKISLDTNQEGFIIDNENKDSACEIWMPALFFPALFIPQNKNIEKGKEVKDSNFKIKVPFLNKNNEIEVSIYEEVPFLKDKYFSSLLKSLVFNFNQCYFGISPGIYNYYNLDKKYNLLDNLISFGSITKKIFSFDNWDLNSETLTSNFYLGESNDIFNSNEGVIGTCESYPEESFWGCSFKEMIFNSINVPLTNENGTLYKIYLVSETHDIYFPKLFEEIFLNYTANLCHVNNDNYLNCTNYFNDSEYVPLQLIEKNEKFIITGQVDNLNRFSNSKDKDKKVQARIRFGNIDYIIFPLILFKKFHIQFDADNKLISFYTNDTSILEIKGKGKNSSSLGTVFIIILIILIILLISFGAYWFFIKRKKNVESNINKFSKFEDEEDYQKMNEKKVF